jgi:glycosyltransferase involved in cell wall biosynthesis
LTYGWGGTDALLAGRLAGLRRVIHTEDGFLPDEAAGQRRKRVLARRLLLRLAERVVCPSRALERIATSIWRLPPRAVVYLPNGVDTLRFAPAAPGEARRARLALGLDPSEVVVGSVGHLRAEKNHARLLAAFAVLARRRPARLLMLGDGPLRAALTDRARALGVGDRVLFAGVVLDPAAYYRAMDLFALSSDTEQMPLALLEAMGAGLAAVSTDVGDVAEMLGPENRQYVVGPSDEGAYASALVSLAEDAVARRAAGEANRRRCVERYDLAVMIRAYLNLYGGDPDVPGSRRTPRQTVARRI